MPPESLSNASTPHNVAEDAEHGFRITVDSAPVPIWTSAEDGLCNWFNQAWLDFTGRSLHQELGNGWIDGVHPDDRQRCVGDYLRSFQERQRFAKEYRLRRHDGEYRWLLDQGAPRFDQNGRFAGYIGCCFDITDQRAAREAAEDAAAQLGEQAMELELANEQLQSSAAELEMANDELQGTAASLEERTDEAERARAAAEAANRRIAFLADATERLASSLEYEPTIARVVALAVPAVAEWAAYSVNEGDETIRLLDIHHVDPAKRSLVLEVARRYPIRADEPAGVAQVLRTGEAELITDLPDTVLEQVAQDADHLVLLRGIGFRSLMTVPVIANGRVLGALSFGSGQSGRRFDADDLTFARELARRAGTAVDHARLFEEARAARHEAEEERARAAGILETMADAHFVLDSEFRFTSANAAMERSVAMPRAELLGRSIWDVFPGTVGTIFERSYRRVVSERVEVHFVGEYDEGSLSLVPEVDAYPAAGGGVAVFWRDIGPRRRAELALVESERQFRTMANAIPTLAWTARSDGYLDWYNARWYAYTGTTPEQMEGWGWQAVQDPAELPEVLARWQASIDTGEPFEMTLPLRGADGRFRRFLTRVVPVHDVTGRVLRWFGTNADVEAERAAREAAESARVEAERQRLVAESANAAKSQFLSTMSHELRTPLNAISGYTELLAMGLRGPLTEAQRQDVQRIHRASRHLMGLVTDVLNFARVDAGQVEIRLVDVELETIVADLDPMLGPELAARSITFAHEDCAPAAADRPHVVRADPEKVRQILLNLLTNAMKFTEAGGRVTLACRTDDAASVVRLQVSDTGRGIPADQLERIFEPFVQVDRHRTRESQQGVGLGLAISRDLARAMSGDLSAESEEGVGSTFTLTLPSGRQRIE